MPELLTEQNFIDAAATLGCEVNAIKAVCQIEAPRGGFDTKGRPVILYEPYLFSDLTKGQFDGKTVTIKDVKYPLSINRRKKPWTVANAQYGPTGIQYDKYLAAAALDADSAAKACSWGKFQILGANYHVCGFDTVAAFVTAMQTDENAHLQAFIHFCQGNKLDKFLQTKNWVEFAFHYNGPKQDKGTADKSDDYSTYIEKAYNKLIK
jgi:hypothetical protein